METLNHLNSINDFNEAKQVIPGGVNSPVRAFKSVGGTPPFIKRGEGPYLIDEDNNTYIDFVQSWGPLIFGHCIRGMVVFGRRWEEFTYFIDKLSKTLHTNDYKKLVIYVHNLAYEFQFMKELIRFALFQVALKRL